MRTLRLALCALIVLNPLTLLAQGPIPTPAGALLLQPMIVIPSSGVNSGGVVIPAQLLLQDGTSPAPSLTFASDTDTGLYRVGANDIGIATNGALAFDVSAIATTVATSSVVFTGTGTTNGIRFVADSVAPTYGQINFSGSNVFPTSVAIESLGGGADKSMYLNVPTAGTFVFSVNNATPVTIGPGTVNATSTIAAGNGNATINGTQNKLIQLTGSTTTLGVELNVGTPTLGTCTGGTMVSGSKNTAMEVTGNTSGSCVVNFGTPIWQNAPLCFVNDESALIAIRISARSTNAITVTGAGSGDAFEVLCLGRVGT